MSAHVYINAQTRLGLMLFVQTVMLLTLRVCVRAGVGVGASWVVLVCLVRYESVCLPACCVLACTYVCVCVRRVYLFFFLFILETNLGLWSVIVIVTFPSLHYYLLQLT